MKRSCSSFGLFHFNNSTNNRYGLINNNLIWRGIRSEGGAACHHLALFMLKSSGHVGQAVQLTHLVHRHGDTGRRQAHWKKWVRHDHKWKIRQTWGADEGAKLKSWHKNRRKLSIQPETSCDSRLANKVLRCCRALRGRGPVGDAATDDGGERRHRPFSQEPSLPPTEEMRWGDDMRTWGDVVSSKFLMSKEIKPVSSFSNSAPPCCWSQLPWKRIIILIFCIFRASAIAVVRPANNII